MKGVRRQLPNPVLSALHPEILPGGVHRILLAGDWSITADYLVALLRQAFPKAVFLLLSPILIHPPAEIAEVWAGEQSDPATIARAQAVQFDLIVPLEPYGLMGDTRPDLERFALAIGARAVAVYEATYGMVRIATPMHLRYRLYARPWVCRAFGTVTLALVVAPLYLIYLMARCFGLWRGSPVMGREA